MNFPIELVVSTDRRFLSRDAATPELLKIVGVDQRWVNHVRILDRQGDLVLLHYINTLVSEGGPLNEEPLREIGHVRGIIVDTANQKIVCRSFDYTPEAVSTDLERVEKLIPSDGFASNIFYRGCEGTVIRLYHFGGEWHIATHRKINAERSYWTGPTFGELFRKLCKFDYDGLDMSKCYIFLLSDDSNRLVYRIPDSGQLLLLGVYNRETDDFMPKCDHPDLTGVKHPERVVVNDLEQLHLLVTDESTNSFDKAGIIVFDSEKSSSPVKIVNEMYNGIRNSRGNEPNLRARYIHTRGTNECTTLRDWFTDESYQTVFNGAETEVEALVKELHSMYIRRYIKKNFDQLPKEEFVTLQRCHTWHTQDRECNIVTRDRVREFVNTTPGHFLLMMLNRKRRAERLVAKKAAQKEAPNQMSE